MLNFTALEPGEFTALSRDILQNILGKRLFLTDRPYDGGVDFTDAPDCHGIVGQAKHYINTPVDKLLRALRQEQEHVKRLRPEAYYLFLSKDLTSQRLRGIIDLFQPFTRFDHNHIFTLSKINDLLQESKYQGILEQYPKLWNFSMDVLGRTFYKSVDFDTREMLLLTQSCKEFVSTESYCSCIELLEQNHVVLLQGAPGTGKTTISRQTALDLARQGYRVHYTTDGKLHDVKGILSYDDTPELILLDDFLGQMYVTLDPGRAGELETLLHFVRRNPSKRLLLNSRITVVQEAERGIPLFSRLLNDIPRVNTDNLTDYEKARILQSHLKKHCADRPEIVRFFASQERYWPIIRHRNFNPRSVSKMANLLSEPLLPEAFYTRFVDLLDNPELIWKQEFEENLRPEDRVLLTTLYSLTNTEVNFELLETCYTARLRAMPGIDPTVDHLGNALTRLNRSMLCQTWDVARKISVLNPSVNDFLRQYIQHHLLEREAIVASAVYFEQIYKVLHQNLFADIQSTPALLALVERKLKDHSLLELRFLERENLANILVYLCVVRQPLQDDVYRDRLLELLRETPISRYQPFSMRSCLDYLRPLFSEPLFSYYQMDRQLSDNALVQALIQSSYSSSSDLFQGLSLIWHALSSPGQKYDHDLTFFCQQATECAVQMLLDEFADLETFLLDEYSMSNYDRLVEVIEPETPVDDVIDYIEGELAYFLEEDLTKQFTAYVLRCVQNALEEQPWFGGEISLDRDTILIDKDIWGQVEDIVESTLLDVLSEEDYDAYTASRRAQTDNFYLDRERIIPLTALDAEQQTAQIRALFEG